MIRAFVLALVIRLGLLLLAYTAGRMLNCFERPLPQEFNSLMSHAFTGWDAIHYMNIARDGYQSQGYARYSIAFFPLYPFLVSLLSYLIRDIVFAGSIVSFGASVAAGYYLQELIHLDHEDEQGMPQRGLLFFFLFPTAYFLVVPYSEALFMALVLWAFVSARRRQWFWVGVAGILLTATRINGLILLPAMAVEALRSEGENTFKKAFWIFFIPLGYVSYLIINWYVLGDPVAFLSIQKEHWDQHFIAPWEQIRLTLEHLLNDPPSKLRTEIFESRFVSIVFTLVVLLGSIRWMRPSYQIYAWGCFTMFMGASWLMSLPRYLLVLFPIYIVLARWFKDPWIVQMLTTVSTLLMGCWFMIYALEVWAF